MLCWRSGLGERAVTVRRTRSLCPMTLVRNHIIPHRLLNKRLLFLNSV